MLKLGFEIAESPARRAAIADGECLDQVVRR
jgi:hypothetical protein